VESSACGVGNLRLSTRRQTVISAVLALVFAEEAIMAKPETNKPLTVRSVDFKLFPTVKIAYPSFGDWHDKYDPHWAHTLHWQELHYQQASIDHLNDITNLLKPIAASTVGKAVLSEFNIHPDNHPYLLPWDFVPREESSDTRATTFPATSSAKPLPGATPLQGKVVCEADRTGPYKCVQSPGIGTASYTYISSTHAGSNADEKLAHELVHAGRICRGLLNKQPMDGDPQNTEDFLANLVENMYRMSTRNGPFIGYSGPVDINSYLTSKSHPGPRDVLSLFRQRQRSLYDVLMHCHTRYNPIAQYEGEIRAQTAFPKAHLTQSG
jgi:hypothetical protein